MKENQVKEIVLTGGPCAGKTTGLSYSQEKLMDRGVRVFLVPEVATMFIKGGVNDISKIAVEDFQKYFEIEKRMLLTQLALRKQFIILANIFSGQKRAAKKAISAGVRHETEVVIAPTDYLFSQAMKDQGSQIIRKDRYCFLYKNQYFELDMFLEPIQINLLEIESTEENDRLELPPFLKIKKEVTDNPYFSNYQIAKRML